MSILDTTEDQYAGGPEHKLAHQFESGATHSRDVGVSASLGQKREDRRGTDGSQTCMGVFLSSGFWFVAFLVWSGKAVPCPVACDQVRGARGKVSRDRNASAA